MVGVRVYTTNIMTPVRDINHQPRFNVDLTEALIKKSVHVYLGSHRHNPEGRVLQKTLQALGCKVTNRMGG